MGKNKYKIEFSGKGYPDYYPAAITLFADSEEKVQQWADEQITTRQLDPRRVEVKITHLPSKG